MGNPMTKNSTEIRFLIAESIRDLYQSVGLRQADIADALNVSHTKVTHWASPKDPVPPSFEELAAVEDVCGVQRGWVLRRCGLIDDPKTVRDAISGDSRIISQVARSMVLAAYDGAIALDS